jgi:8-oxo-dGTP diphosphatase
MVKREVREELGVEIEIIRFLGFTNHIIESEKQHWISLGFLAKIKHGEPINKEPDKHDEIGWFDLKKLPEKISKPTREGIKQYLSARIPSSFGF